VYCLLHRVATHCRWDLYQAGRAAARAIGLSGIMRAGMLVVRPELVADVAHELRTPIASLKALVETLEEGAVEDPPAAREFVRLMQVEVSKLAGLVDELLELSRLEAGAVAMQPQVIDPAELAQATIRRIAPQARRAGIALQLEVEPQLPPVRADAGRIEQVLLNLLLNAIKFTPAGGRITLQVARAAGAGAGDDQVHFAIADTGAGIPPEEQGRLFERFFQGEHPARLAGTGLGLAIAKRLVEAHHGRIWVESAGEGRGATFTFTLPRAGDSPPG
jgi:two-component system phosphate regulon sensor histidine kinase PhoR